MKKNLHLYTKNSLSNQLHTPSSKCINNSKTPHLHSKDNIFKYPKSTKNSQKKMHCLNFEQNEKINLELTNNNKFNTITPKTKMSKKQLISKPVQATSKSPKNNLKESENPFFPKDFENIKNKVNSVKNSSSIRPNLFMSPKFQKERKITLKNVKLKTDKEPPNPRAKAHKSVTRIIRDESTINNHGSSKKEKPSEVVDPEFIKFFKRDHFLSIINKINSIEIILSEGQDCTEQIRDMMDFVQKEETKSVDYLLNCSNKISKLIYSCLKLGFILTMQIFTLLINNKSFPYEKCLIGLKSFSRTISTMIEKTEEYKINDLSATGKKFKRSSTNFEEIEKIDKTKLILEQIVILLSMRFGPKDAKKINSLMISIQMYPLSEVIERILLFFVAFLEGKEQPDSLNRDTCNFIIQPFNNKPFLPEKSIEREFTLVLDLDETLIHFAPITESKGCFFIRPFLKKFLNKLAPYYEIVVFTAAIKSYADWIIDRIDPNQLISHRLYRCSTNNQSGVFIKDLSQLGRSLSTCIIVDNCMENFKFHPENGIYIRNWYNDPEDGALKELCGVLLDLIQLKQNSVQERLSFLKQSISQLSK